MALWEVSLWTSLLILYAIHYVLFQPMCNGMLLAFLLKPFLTKNERVRIGAITLSPLSGRLYVNRLTYSTRNISCRMVDGSLTFRWWRRKVRGGWGDCKTDVPLEGPSRLACVINGMEWLWINNTFRWDHLERLFEQRGGDLSSVGLKPTKKKAPLTKPPANEKQPLSTFFKWFPCIDCTGSHGCMMFGNKEMPTVMVMSYSRGHGVYALAKSPNPKDMFRYFWDYELQRAKLTFVENIDYRGDNPSLEPPPPLDQEESLFVKEGISYFTNYHKMEKYVGLDDDIGSDIEPEMEPEEKGRAKNSSLAPEATPIKLGRGASSLSSRNAAKRHSMNSNPSSRGDEVPEEDMKDIDDEDEKESSKGIVGKILGQICIFIWCFLCPLCVPFCWLNRRSKDYRSKKLKETPIFDTTMTRIKYYSDDAGNVHEGHEKFDPVDAPQFGYDITFHGKTTVKYGPWHDRQRFAMKNFFFPWDYAIRKPTEQKVGQRREYGWLTWSFTFIDEAEFVIPFVQFSKEAQLREFGKKPKPGLIEMKVQKGGFFKFATPWGTPDDGSGGTTIVIEANIPGMSLVTSTNNASLCDAQRMDIRCDMFYSNIWNDPSDWKFTFDLDTPKVFFNYEHVFLFMDCTKDWMRGSQPDLRHFVPYKYTYSIKFKQPTVNLNVNPYHIVSKHNDLTSNAYFVIQANTIDISLDQNATIFRDQKSGFDMAIELLSPSAHISLPEKNRVKPHLGHGSTPLASCDIFTVTGWYKYHRQTHPSFMDRCRLNADAKNAKIFRFYSVYVKYLVALLYNTFMYHVIPITPKEFKEAGNKHLKTPEFYRRLNTDENGELIPKNKFELYFNLRVSPLNVIVPLTFYGHDEYADAVVNELMLDLRSMPEYMNVHLSTTQLSVHFPTTTRYQSVDVSHHDSMRQKCNTILRLDEFAYHLTSLWGPVSPSWVYHMRHKVNIGNVDALLFPQQLVNVAVCVIVIAYNAIVPDNPDLKGNPTNPPNPIFQQLDLRVNSINAMVCHPHENIFITLDLPTGIECHWVSLISQEFHHRVKLHIPCITLKMLADNDCPALHDGVDLVKKYSLPLENIRDGSEWSELLLLSTSFNVEFLRRLPTWREDMLKQIKFFKWEDRSHHHCHWLWQNGTADDEHLILAQTKAVKDGSAFGTEFKDRGPGGPRGKKAEKARAQEDFELTEQIPESPNMGSVHQGSSQSGSGSYRNFLRQYKYKRVEGFDAFQDDTPFGLGYGVVAQFPMPQFVPVPYKQGLASPEFRSSNQSSNNGNSFARKSSVVLSSNGPAIPPGESEDAALYSSTAKVMVFYVEVSSANVVLTPLVFRCADSLMQTMKPFLADPISLFDEYQLSKFYEPQGATTTLPEERPSHANRLQVGVSARSINVQLLQLAPVRLTSAKRKQMMLASKLGFESVEVSFTTSSLVWNPPVPVAVMPAIAEEKGRESIWGRIGAKSTLENMASSATVARTAARFGLPVDRRRDKFVDMSAQLRKEKRQLVQVSVDVRGAHALIKRCRRAHKKKQGIPESSLHSYVLQAIGKMDDVMICFDLDHLQIDARIKNAAWPDPSTPNSTKISCSAILADALLKTTLMSPAFFLAAFSGWTWDIVNFTYLCAIFSQRRRNAMLLLIAEMIRIRQSEMKSGTKKNRWNKADNWLHKQWKDGHNPWKKLAQLRFYWRALTDEEKLEIEAKLRTAKHGDPSVHIVDFVSEYFPRVMPHSSSKEEKLLALKAPPPANMEVEVAVKTGGVIGVMLLDPYEPTCSLLFQESHISVRAISITHILPRPRMTRPNFFERFQKRRKPTTADSYRNFDVVATATLSGAFATVHPWVIGIGFLIADMLKRRQTIIPKYPEPPQHSHDEETNFKSGTVVRVESDAMVGNAITGKKNFAEKYGIDFKVMRGVLEPVPKRLGFVDAGNTPVPVAPPQPDTERVIPKPRITAFVLVSCKRLRLYASAPASAQFSASLYDATLSVSYLNGSPLEASANGAAARQNTDRPSMDKPRPPGGSGVGYESFNEELRSDNNSFSDFEEFAGDRSRAGDPQGQTQSAKLNHSVFLNVNRVCIRVEEKNPSNNDIDNSMGDSQGKKKPFQSTENDDSAPVMMELTISGVQVHECLVRASDLLHITDIGTSANQLFLLANMSGFHFHMPLYTLKPEEIAAFGSAWLVATRGRSTQPFRTRKAAADTASEAGISQGAPGTFSDVDRGEGNLRPSSNLSIGAKVLLSLQELKVDIDLLPTVRVEYTLKDSRAGVHRNAVGEFDFDLNMGGVNTITFVTSYMGGPAHSMPGWVSISQLEEKLRNIALPHLRITAATRRSSDVTELRCSARVARLSNVVDIDLLHYLLQLQTTLSDEMKKGLESISDVTKQTKRRLNRTVEEGKGAKFSERFRISLMIQFDGVSILLCSPHSNISFETGVISVSVKGGKKRKARMSNYVDYFSPLVYSVVIDSVRLNVYSESQTLKVPDEDNGAAPTQPMYGPTGSINPDYQNMDQGETGERERGSIHEVDREEFFSMALSLSAHNTIHATQESKNTPEVMLQVNNTTVKVYPGVTAATTGLFGYYRNAYQNYRIKRSERSVDLGPLDSTVEQVISDIDAEVRSAKQGHLKNISFRLALTNTAVFLHYQPVRPSTVSAEDTALREMRSVLGTSGRTGTSDSHSAVALTLRSIIFFAGLNEMPDATPFQQYQPNAAMSIEGSTPPNSLGRGTVLNVLANISFRKLAVAVLPKFKEYPDASRFYDTRPMNSALFPHGEVNAVVRRRQRDLLGWLSFEVEDSALAIDTMLVRSLMEVVRSWKGERPHAVMKEAPKTSQLRTYRKLPVPSKPRTVELDIRVRIFPGECLIFDLQKRSSSANALQSLPLPLLSVAVRHTRHTPSREGIHTFIQVTFGLRPISLTPMLLQWFRGTIATLSDWNPNDDLLTNSTISKAAANSPAKPTRSRSGSYPIKWNTNDTLCVSLLVTPISLSLETFSYRNPTLVVELDKINVFWSGSRSPEGVLLFSATAAVSKVEVRVINKVNTDACLVLRVDSTELNVGQAYGLRHDNNALYSIMMNIRRVLLSTDTQQLEDSFVIYNVWVGNTISDIKNANITQRMKYQRAAEKGMREARTISVFFHLGVREFLFGGDLWSSIGKMSVSLQRFSLHVCKHGRLSELTSSNETFSVRCGLGSLSMNLRGRLKGKGGVGGLVLHGVRMPSNFAEPSPKNGLNKVCLSIAPAMFDLEYDLEPIIGFRSGDVDLRIIDVVDSIEKKRCHQQASIVLEFITLKVSAMTSPAFIKMAFKTMEFVKERKEEAVVLAEKSKVGMDRAFKLRSVQSPETNTAQHSTDATTHGEGLTSFTLLPETPVKQDADEKKGAFIDRILRKMGPPLGELIVRGDNISMSVYGESMRHSTWINFTMESYELNFMQVTKRMDEIHRSLTLLFGKNYIVKMSQNSIQDWIFRVPATSLEMYTKQLKDSRIVNYTYICNFEGSIDVTTNIGMYTFIREIAVMYRNHLVAVMQESKGFNAPVVTTTSSSSPASKSNAVVAKRTFKGDEFRLEPQLNVLDGITPSVQNILSWLGIRDRHLIASYTHIGVTDNLEKALTVLCWVIHNVDKALD